MLGSNLQNLDSRDSDGDGDRNDNQNEEHEPKFVQRWRPLYDASVFEQNIRTTTAADSVASNFAFGATYVEPLIGVGRNGSGGVHNFVPSFSRFNFAAPFQDKHPLVEAIRSEFGGNNKNYTLGREGLKRVNTVAFDNNTNTSGISDVLWDDNQVDGALGYAFVTHADDGSDSYVGLEFIG